MTEEQIERLVELRIDLIDRAWLRVGCPWTEAEYFEHIRAIDRWAEQRRAER